MSQAIFHDIRPSPIAGQWYPGQRDQLAASIDAYLDAKPPAEVPGTVIGLVAPHAGHIYSGPIAADAFRLVRGRSFRRVVVVSPMHSFFPQAVLTSGHDAYSTPLGTIPVDREAVEAIGKRVKLSGVRKDPEHALEIELPFLQRALGEGFSLVPLMVRDQSAEMAEKLGGAIADTVGTRIRCWSPAATCRISILMRRRMRWTKSCWATSRSLTRKGSSGRTTKARHSPAAGRPWRRCWSRRGGWAQTT